MWGYIFYIEVAKNGEINGTYIKEFKKHMEMLKP